MTKDQKKSLIAEGAQIANNLQLDSTSLVPVDIEKSAARLMEIFGDLFIEESE